MSKLTDQDLDNFIRNKRSEDRFLEFKSKVTIDGNEKFELCRDVVAFANSDGGDIVYGFEAINGSEYSIVGIEGNFDDLKLRIQQILNSNVEPKLLGLDIYEIKKCLVISISRSWNAPHAIKLEGSKYQFPYRTDSGKAYFDIPTLKDEIMKNTKLTHDIHKLVNYRINVFLKENVNEFKDENKIFTLVHLVPLSSFYSREIIDVQALNNDSRKKGYDNLLPFGVKPGENVAGLLNLEGLRIFRPEYSKTVQNQFFRNGGIEARYSFGPIIASNDRYIDEKKFESDLCEGLKRCMDFFKQQNIYGDIIVFINLFNIKNCYLTRNAKERDPPPHAINQDRVDLGNIIVKPDETEGALEPILKIFFHVFGLPKPD